MRYEILIYEDLYSGTAPGDPAAVCIYANSKKELCIGDTNISSGITN